MMSTHANAAPSGWRELIAKEDWWAIWIGLGLVVAAVIAFSQGVSFKWVAVAPQKWSTLADVGTQLQANGLRYIALFVLWAVLFGIAVKAMGLKLGEFVGAFAVVFAVSTLIYFIGVWDQASKYNLEPPLVALALGLLISNVFGIPNWLRTG